MESLITNGIRVSVEAQFEPNYSDLNVDKYVFSYHVTIQNLSNDTVQLLTRHWKIFDMAGSIREVEGEGVVGQQPVLRPGESHEYQSWCPLTTPLGFMEGSFQMEVYGADDTMEVRIPRFELTVPFALN